MQSKAKTVEAYLAELPPDRRAAITAVRKVILDNLDPDIEEGMSYGMIGYSVPHRVYPNGYHCDPAQPLPYAGLASQKGNMALYLAGVYCGCDGGELTKNAEWFRQAWLKTGKKLDMGKACIRFKKIEDVPLEVVGEAIRRASAKDYIKLYEEERESVRKAKGEKASATLKPASPRATAKPATKRTLAAPAKKKTAKR